MPLRIDDLDPGDDLRGLLLPRLTGQEAPVDEHHVELGLLKGQGHLLEVGPVGGAQLLEGLEIVLLRILPVARAAVFQEAQLVVPEQRNRLVLARKVDHAAAIGPAVDEVAKQDEPVVALESEPFEHFGEFQMASVDVADGDEASVHSDYNLLASVRARSKQDSRWIWIHTRILRRPRRKIALRIQGASRRRRRRGLPSTFSRSQRPAS